MLYTCWNEWCVFWLYCTSVVLSCYVLYMFNVFYLTIKISKIKKKGSYKKAALLHIGYTNVDNVSCPHFFSFYSFSNRNNRYMVILAILQLKKDSYLIISRGFSRWKDLKIKKYIPSIYTGLIGINVG